MAAPAPSNFFGTLPIVLHGEEGYPTGDKELDELEFDVVCTPATWLTEITAMGIIRGKLLPSPDFPYFAMFAHSFAPVAFGKETITIKVISKGLLVDYTKARHSVIYEDGYYTPEGSPVPVITALPAIISELFVTTSAAAFDHTKGAVTTPPLSSLPDPFGDLEGRQWILSRQNAQQIYFGNPLDAVQGLWKVQKALWYVPIITP